MDTLKEVTEHITERAKKEDTLNGRIKFIFPEGILHIDGTGITNVVSNEDLPADCTIRMKMRTFARIHDGKTDAVAAFLFGKIKVKGDNLLALKIKSLI